MAWEDGVVNSVHLLIEAADYADNGSRKRELLTQALTSARVVTDDYQRDNLVKLIEDKLRSL